MPDLPNLRHLRALGAVVRLGSISAAAGEVGLSQPALTQGLAKLERQLGARLFDRLPRGLRPTEIGAEVILRTERASALFAASVAQAAGAGRHVNVTAAQVAALSALLEGGTLMEASRLAAVAPASLHRAIRELERLSGLALTERRRGGLFLSGTGRRVAQDVALGLAELDAAFQDAARQTTRIAVGAMALSRSMLIPTVLAELALSDAETQVDVVDGSYGELVHGLRHGTIDVVVGTLRDAPERDLQQEVLLEDRITVIGRNGHPLQHRRPSLEQLTHYPWIVGRRTSALLDRWQQIFDAADVARPRAPIHCGSVTTIRGVLVRSNFLTLLSRDQVQMEIEAGLLAVIASHVPDTARTIGAITRRDWLPTETQARFLGLLREAASRVARAEDRGATAPKRSRRSSPRGRPDGR